MLPREYASIYFNAIDSWSVCIEPGSDTQMRWMRDGAGIPEQILWKHLNDYGATVRFYPFPYVIVRPSSVLPSQPFNDKEITEKVSSGGGVCKSLWNHLSELCLVLHDLNRSPFQYTSNLENNKEDMIISNSDVTACTFTLFKATEVICEDKFPIYTTNDDDSLNIPSNLNAIDIEYSLKILKTLENINHINTQSLHFSPLSPSSHPIIMTSTGGEYQNGQVASALLISNRNIHKVELSFKCILIEYEYIINSILTKYVHDSFLNSIHPFDIGRRCNNAIFTSFETNSSLLSELVHGAEMALIESTLTQVTCMGTKCTADGEDYQILVNSLKHHMQGSGDK